jgi:threonine synthase
MDVGAPSNYERMMTMTGGDIAAIREEIVGFASSDEEIRTGIREMYERYGYISDPHSAVGYNAAQHYGVNGFWLSTAAPAKFGEVIEPTLGIAPEIPERLARLLGRPKISTSIAPDSALLKDFVAGL